MSTALPPRDLERLSAFLDDALTPRQAAELGARLKVEPALAQSLRELQATRTLLRRAPKRRAPRSFALTPAMTGAEKPRAYGGWGSLNLVSALATILLVVVFAGDFWANNYFPAGPEQAPQALMAVEAPKYEGDATADDAAGAEMAEEYAGETEMVEPTLRMEQPAQPFDLRVFLWDYARPLEIGLAALALVAALIAWRARHRAR